MSDRYQLHKGDCLEVLSSMDADSVDAVVTDPPYGLSFMGKDWDHGVPGERFWREVGRVAKPGCHLLAFGGTRTFHRLTCAIEDAGWEIRDCVMWVYGSGFPKSHNLDGDWKGWGTALKPAWEPIIVARKPLVGTVAANVQRYGTGAMNIDKSRIVAGQRPTIGAWEPDQNLCSSCAANAARSVKRSTPATEASSAPETVSRQASETGQTRLADTSKTGTGCFDGMRVGDSSINWNTGEFGSRRTAQYPTTAKSTTSTATNSTTACRTCDACGSSITDPCTSASITPKKRSAPHAPSNSVHAAPVGRWPSNLVHDGSDEVVAGFPQSKGQQGDVRGTEQSRTGGEGTSCYGEYGRMPSPRRGDSGSAARFFYCAKASKRDRDEGLEGLEGRFSPTMGNGIGDKEHDPSTATPKRNHHPTVKPTDLMRYLCRLVTPPDGVVLDPFMGSGSTGKAATLEGFRFVGIDMNAEYVDIARARIEHAAKEQKEPSGLFEQPA